MTTTTQEIPITGTMIRLGQFLKLAGAVDTGAEAKHRVQNSEVMVNGTVETRRGRQLHPGDRVTAWGRKEYLITATTP